MYGDQLVLIHSIVQDLHNGYIDKMVFIFQELHQNKKLLLKKRSKPAKKNLRKNSPTWQMFM